MHGDQVRHTGEDAAGPQIFRRLWKTGLLTPSDMRALAALPWKRELYEADMAIRCNEDFCILASGLALRQRWDEDGSRQVLSLILPGDICTYSAITGHQSASTLSTVANSSMMRTSISDIAGLAERRPNIMAAILGNLAHDMAATEELLVLIGRRPAIVRIAHLFCELEYRLRRMGLARDAQYVLNLTQAEIGDHVALSAVHVNRTMQELRRRNLVRNRGPRFSLPDLGELQRIARFSPAYLGETPDQWAAAE